MKKKISISISISILAIVIISIILNLFNLYFAYTPGTGLDEVKYVNVKILPSIIVVISSFIILYYEIFYNKIDKNSKKIHIIIRKVLLVISILIIIFTPCIGFKSIGNGARTDNQEVYNIIGINAYKLLTSDSARWWLVIILLIITLLGIIITLLNVSERLKKYYDNNFQKERIKREDKKKETIL